MTLIVAGLWVMWGILFAVAVGSLFLFIYLIAFSPDRNEPVWVRNTDAGVIGFTFALSLGLWGVFSSILGSLLKGG